MPELSLLRLSAILGGAAVLVLLFYRLRRHRDDGLPTLLAGAGGGALVLLGAFPGLSNVPAELFSLRDQQGGRLITLLILAVAALWFLVVWNRSKIAHLGRQQDRLLRQLARERIQWPDAVEPDAPGRDVWVVIPALDEADNLDALLPRLGALDQGRAIQPLVVDDGSTDSTVRVALRHGAVVVTMPVNGGGGLALRTGFDLALAQGARVVVTMDADGQHDPGELSRLLVPLDEGRADIVIGSRALGRAESVSRTRDLGAVVFNTLISRLLGIRVTDCASGYRALGASALQGVHLEQPQYHTAELIIDAAKRGYRITEVPITIRGRLSGKSRKGRDLFYGAMFLRTIVKTWLR